MRRSALGALGKFIPKDYRSIPSGRYPAVGPLFVSLLVSHYYAGGRRAVKGEHIKAQPKKLGYWLSLMNSVKLGIESCIAVRDSKP